MERFLKKSVHIRKKLIKKLFTSEIYRLKRVEFTKNYLEKGPDLWNKVILIDEAMVRSQPNFKEVFHIVQNSVKCDNLSFNHQMQNGDFGVMFRGCFSRTGLGPFIAIDENLNSEKYINLLKNNILPKIHESQSGFIYMHENAPCHAFRAVKAFLNQENVTALKWPMKSPNMNPIKNLWAIIKRQLASEFSPLTKRNQLIADVTAVFNGISPKTCQDLADSMTKHLNLLI